MISRAPAHQLTRAPAHANVERVANQFRMRLALLAPYALSYVKPGSPLIASAAFACGVGLWRPLKAAAGQAAHSEAWRVQLQRFTTTLISLISTFGMLALTSWWVDSYLLSGAALCSVLIAAPALLRSRFVSLIGLVLALSISAVLALQGLHAWVLSLLLASGLLMGLVNEHSSPLTARSRSFLLAGVALFGFGAAWHQLLDPSELIALLAFGLAASALSPA